MLLTLRAYLSSAHARGLVSTGLVDKEVMDPLFEERMHRIATQLSAALALRATLLQLGHEYLPNDTDLAPLVNMAEQCGVLNRREAGILRHINQMAVEAKHRLDFVSRL